MDTTSLIGQDSYTNAMQKQAAAMGASMSGTTGASGKNTPDLKKVHEAAQKFESFFVGQMMEQMSAGVETDETFGGGHGEDMWKSMLNQEYGKEIAKSGRLGISDQVMKGMLQMQEQRTKAAESARAGAGATQAGPVQTSADALTEDFSQQDAAVAMVAGTRLPAKR